HLRALRGRHFLQLLGGQGHAGDVHGDRVLPQAGLHRKALGGEQGQGDGDGAGGRDHHFSAVVHAARSSARREEALSAAPRCAGKRGRAVAAKVAPGAGQAIAANLSVRGGKSGLQWTRCQVTPGGREPTESATESKPPKCRKALVRVKGCGKSAPRRWQHSTARQTPPGARPNREVGAHPQGWGASVGPALLPGRLLEGRGDAAPRGMIAQDRTRLIGQLLLFLALNPKSR